MFRSLTQKLIPLLIVTLAVIRLSLLAVRMLDSEPAEDVYIIPPSETAELDAAQIETVSNQRCAALNTRGRELLRDNFNEVAPLEGPALALETFGK